MNIIHCLRPSLEVVAFDVAAVGAREVSGAIGARRVPREFGARRCR
jgi:hypothetical protein